MHIYRGHNMFGFVSLVCYSSISRLVLRLGPQFVAPYSILLFFIFFFSSRRRHTRFKCDWSSDVCSSDLFSAKLPASLAHSGLHPLSEPRPSYWPPVRRDSRRARLRYAHLAHAANMEEIGRASCRERV